MRREERVKSCDKINSRYKTIDKSDSYTESILTCPIFVDKDEISIKVRLKYAKLEKNKLLIDSGAQLSLIKLKFIKIRQMIDTSSTLNFTGVVNGVKGTTYGTINSGVFINKTFLSHNFHVVHNNLEIGNLDGALGNDFLNKYKAIINYELKEINLIGSKIRKENVMSSLTISNNQRVDDNSVATILDRAFLGNRRKNFSN